MLTKDIIIFAFNFPMPAGEELDYVRTVVSKEAEQVHGMYKGVSELSYVVPLTSGIDHRALRIILNNTEQESILVVDRLRGAYLLFQEDYYKYGDNSIYLGHLVEVGILSALEQEAYTYDPMNDKYYICSGI